MRYRRRLYALAAVVVAALIGVLGAAPAQAVDVISCAVQVQYAHGSTHVSGTINVVSTVKCTQSVMALKQTTALYKVGGPSWWGTPGTSVGSPSVQSNAATSCSQGPGEFYGAAVTQVTWPSGYVGNVQSTSYGATTSVACGIAARVAAGEQVSDAPVTVAVLTATRTG
ncbi:hypothetical protein JVX92_15025 (plasmid) [Microbacterium hominis]|uniref:hypothetical protein n=1 Tax=Microbacterium hominis TaxID=162426 RepID=UPI001965A781|nr:hypothetical protein [Microbacterium hominis]QRY42348.1 hypothetical protein JVX92_15025 [Microbacterium hominis]